MSELNDYFQDYKQAVDALIERISNTDCGNAAQPFIDAVNYELHHTLSQVDDADKRINELEDAVKDIKTELNTCRDLLSVEIEKNQVLTEFSETMESIINKSEGVAGYHLNGDVAPWDQLLTTEE